MLRLPPTSIGLDQKDLEIIKKRLNERMSLYRQGYKKSQLIAYHEEMQRAIEQDHKNLIQETSTSSPLVSPPVSLPYRTSAVRHSSLLRFHQNASSTSPEAPIAPVIEPNFSPGRKSYRPRSQTYPWAESEDGTTAERTPDAQELDSEIADLIVRARNMTLRPSSPISRPQPPIRSALRPEAREFTPLYRPAAVNKWAASLASRLPSDNYQIRGSPELPPRILPPTTPPRRSSLAFMLCGPSNEPSSRRSSIQLPPPISPPGRPTAPETRAHPTHRLQTPTQSSSFRVYNDRIAPASQPQTPLDLSHPRWPQTAPLYTAPPGLPAHVYRNPRVPSGASPVARARQLRIRREREERRERDGVLVEDGEGGWTEEWDIDRIGEENY